MKNFVIYFIDSGSSNPLKYTERTIVTAETAQIASKQFISEMLANGSNLFISSVEELSY